MGIKPEDRPKMFGLIAALLGVVAYMLFALVPKLTAGAAAPKDATSGTLTAASAQTASAGQTGSGDASAALPDDDTAPPPPVPPRDSFTPPPASYQRPVRVAPTVPGGQALSPGMQPAVPIVAIPGLPGGRPAAPTAPPKAPLPPVELKGVILGDPSVAVLSVNGEVVERQVGDLIIGDLRLASIADVGITVQDGKKLIAVTVGHLMPGSTQQAGQPAAAAPAPAPQAQQPIAAISP